MFTKAIRFRDVRPGDVVCEEIDGEQFEIERVEGPRDETYPKIILWIKDRNLANLHGDPNAIIGLVHRSWPEGKTEADMLKGMESALWDITQAADWKKAPQFFQSFRDAVDAYELGRPQEERS